MLCDARMCDKVGWAEGSMVCVCYKITLLIKKKKSGIQILASWVGLKLPGRAA